MAFSGLDNFVAKLTGGSSGAPDNTFYYKDPRVGASAAVAPVSRRGVSLWQYNGHPSDGAAPTTAAIPTNATVGGLRQVDPSGGLSKWMTSFSGASMTIGTLIIYDRLLHIGNLDGTVTTAQTVQSAGSPALTRYTNGLWNQVWIEVYTQIGATSRTITMSYTNEDGTAGQTSQAVAIGNTGLREAQRIIPLTLAQGDIGVQGVASVTLSASTGTAGNFGVVVAHPLAMISFPATGVVDMRSYLDGVLQQVNTDACLALAWFSNSTTVPQVFGQVQMVEA